MYRDPTIPRSDSNVGYDFAKLTATQAAVLQLAVTMAVPKYLPLIGRADRQFWLWPWRHTDSEKSYEFLKRSACVKNRMAVWDNGLLPLFAANQKRVVKSESRNTYGKTGLFLDSSPL